MNRADTVKEIMSQLKDDDIVIASTGLISREVFKYDRPLNFYMQGSMGNTLAIGIGLAMNVKQRVFVLDGDGSALMGLGSMVTANSLRLDNLYHLIIDNGCHESTGGQYTASVFINFELLGKNVFVYKILPSEEVPPRISLGCKEITERFKNAIAGLSNK